MAKNLLVIDELLCFKPNFWISYDSWLVNMTVFNIFVNPSVVLLWDCLTKGESRRWNSWVNIRTFLWILARHCKVSPNCSFLCKFWQNINTGALGWQWSYLNYKTLLAFIRNCLQFNFQSKVSSSSFQRMAAFSNFLSRIWSPFICDSSRTKFLKHVLSYTVILSTPWFFGPGYSGRVNILL